MLTVRYLLHHTWHIQVLILRCVEEQIVINIMSSMSEVDYTGIKVQPVRSVLLINILLCVEFSSGG